MIEKTFKFAIHTVPIIENDKGEVNMDHMKIESRFMRNMISKLISKMIFKKLGYKVDIRLNDAITVDVKDGKAHVHLNVDAEMNTDEFKKFTKLVEQED